MTWPKISDLLSFMLLPVGSYDKIPEKGKYPLEPAAVFPSKIGTPETKTSDKFGEVVDATKYLGDSIKLSTNVLIHNKNSNLPITYKFTFRRNQASASTLLMTEDLNKRMKQVMGNLSTTDVSGVFTVDLETRRALTAGQKIWQINIEGEETTIPKANFDIMTASSLFGLTNSNRVVILLNIVDRAAAQTDNYSW